LVESFDAPTIALLAGLYGITGPTFAITFWTNYMAGNFEFLCVSEFNGSLDHLFQY
jgi:hypothetical protein